MFTLQVQANGTPDTFTLLDQLDHVGNPGNGENNLTISLGSLIEVVDEDGDALSAPSGDITLNIGDDIPNAVVVINTPDTLALDETRPVGTETDGDSAPAGLDTVTVNLAGNFAACRLRQRRTWQRDLFAGADRFERGVRAVCAGCGRHHLG